MSHKADASTESLIPLVAALRARGVSPEPVLVEAHLEEGHLAQRDLRIDNARVLAAWERAAEIGGEHIGLEAAALAPSGLIHLIDYLITTAPTLREGVATAARHLRLLKDVAELVTEDDGEICQIQFAPNRRIPVPRAEMEFYVARAARLCRLALGTSEPFVAVHFPHPAPVDRTPTRRVFAAPIRYGAPCAALHLASAQMDRPTVTGDVPLFAILQQHGALLLQRTPSVGGFRLDVRHLVATAFPEVPSLDQAARRLGVSSRTLRRHLADEGTSYKAVVDDVRLETTTRLLQDQRLDLEEIASRVGFTSAGTLARAFRRWQGVSPARFRGEIRGEQGPPLSDAGWAQRSTSSTSSGVGSSQKR